MTAPPILFMRIHKTAGEALAKQVLSRLPKDDVCPEEFEWKIRNLPADEIRGYRFFAGHISPAALSETIGSLRVFTMLRDPRERLLSCFYYWKAGSRHASGEFFDAIRSLSLLDFLRSDIPIVRRATWNVQARLIAGGQFGGVDGFRQNVFGPWLGDGDLASEAIRALDRFLFVGTAEHYQHALRQVCEHMDLGPPPAPELVNVNSEKPASYAGVLADPDISEALAHLTEADRAVYAAVLGRWSP